MPGQDLSGGVAGAPEPRPLDRAAMVDRLLNEIFDIAIIGGGINGAAIARDASIRGLKVALIDKGDFAGETSSRSSKLIHGGLRYLPQGQVRLVYHALRERERLRRLTAPHLVRPIHFLMPFYRGRRPGRVAIRTGLALYDLMALTPRAERHRGLWASEVLALQPGLLDDGLIGGATFYDGWGDDARLTIENVLDAVNHGAAVANYVAAEGLIRTNAKLSAVAARDHETKVSLEISARRIINAAGPWVTHVRQMNNPECVTKIRLTKGVHIVVNARRLPIRMALVLTDRDGRIIFLMAEGRQVLIGTSDTDFADEPARARVDAEDVNYLLAIVNEALPEAALRPADVVASFAGLRALSTVAPAVSASRLPRDELIDESTSGLITVAGGKLTTHRAIAEAVMNRIGPGLGIPRGPSPTRQTPLPGARPLRSNPSALRQIPVSIRTSLCDRYGSRAELVARIAVENPQLAVPLPGDGSVLAAEVVFAVRYEMARSTADFLVRRTALSWRAPSDAREAAPAVARLMASELGWDHNRESAELQQFQSGQMNPSGST